MKLSILICTIIERSDNFASRILKELQSQRHKSKYRDQVEIIYLGDDCQMSVGEKRNKLISMGKGIYCCFVDDDDTLNQNYIAEIFEGFRIAPDKDCYNFMVSYSNGMDHKNTPVYYSIAYEKDRNTSSSFERLPNHLMVIKKSIAERVKFKEIDRGEDTLWAREVQPLLKTEHLIPKVLYYYNWNPSTTATQRNR